MCYKMMEWKRGLHATYLMKPVVAPSDWRSIDCQCFELEAPPCERNAKTYTISCTLLTIGALFDEINSVSPFWRPPRSLHGLQKPIISSCSELGKQTWANGDSQSGRNLVPSEVSRLIFNPNTSICPDTAVPAASPFNRSMCVMFEVTTEAWSHIMQDVKSPNRTASTTKPKTFINCVGRSRHVKWCVRGCPWMCMQATNRAISRDKE